MLTIWKFALPFIGVIYLQVKAGENNLEVLNIPFPLDTIDLILFIVITYDALSSIYAITLLHYLVLDTCTDKGEALRTTFQTSLGIGQIYNATPLKYGSFAGSSIRLSMYYLPNFVLFVLILLDPPGSAMILFLAGCFLAITACSYITIPDTLLEIYDNPSDFYGNGKVGANAGKYFRTSSIGVLFWEAIALIAT